MIAFPGLNVDRQVVRGTCGCLNISGDVQLFIWDGGNLHPFM